MRMCCINYRQYIWQGGTYPRSNPDGTAHPKAGQAWCFVYGEQEWLSGVSYSEALNQTKRIINGNSNVGDTDYETACQ